MQFGGKAASGEQVPRLGPEVDPARLVLTPAEGYLLSRIDGRTSWDQLRQIGGLPSREVDRCLERWLSEGVLVVDGAQAARPAKATPKSTDAAPARGAQASAPEHPDLDASLDISLELQRRILDFAGRLDAPYHEILGVPRDADRKALRHAYFQLSKELHPDRYFRRKLGPFAKRLERVFGKVVEAYELLSDPTARAEIERSLAAATPPDAAVRAPAAGAEAEAAPDRAGAPPLRRRPHVFSVPSRMLKERKARAKRFFESGMAASNAGRFLEAAGAVRLAIAHDPWNAVYKEQFVDVQRKAHEERARQLVKEAESALELRDYTAALHSFEEALHYRPHDAELLRRAAKLAFASGGDLHQAKEWAASAVEIEPRDAAAHRLLGQIFKGAGLEANARRELEIALQLDPNDEEARAELRASGPLQALRRLGGKRWVG